tara:strand:- start:830 stop:1594 length:765 start_codon:yes stop_codon:yes gene_type:complete
MAEEQAPATEEVVQQTEDVSHETIAERPEHIPEKFWNTETGELRQDDMIKSYNNLEKFATGKKEEMKEATLAELKAEADELVPEKYELPKLVEGITEEMVRENPMTEWWEEKCKEFGLSQDQYEEGVNKWVDIIMKSGPNLETEMDKLGENAKDRIDAVTNYAKTQFPPEEFELIAQTLGTSATGIAALERIMDMGKSQMGRSEQVAQPERELTVADVKDMMNDKRYFDQRHRDKEYVRKVDDAWARLNNAGKV